MITENYAKIHYEIAIANGQKMFNFVFTLQIAHKMDGRRYQMRHGKWAKPTTIEDRESG